MHIRRLFISDVKKTPNEKKNKDLFNRVQYYTWHRYRLQVVLKIFSEK